MSADSGKISKKAKLKARVSQPVHEAPPPPKPAVPVDPICRVPLRISPADIDFFEGNPRRGENPNHEEIKANILGEGDLDHPLPISRNPETKRYVTYKGGNTRLKIVKEAWEKGDERFEFVRCEYHPWEGWAAGLAYSLAENILRSDLPWIDQALQVAAIKKDLDSRSPKPLSAPMLAEWMLTHYKLKKSERTIQFYLLSARFHQYIPLALDGGGRQKIVEELSKLEDHSYDVFIFHSGAQSLRGLTKDEYSGGLYGDALSRVDARQGFSVDFAKESLLKLLSERLELSVDFLGKQLEIASQGGDLSKAETQEQQSESETTIESGDEETEPSLESPGTEILTELSEPDAQEWGEAQGWLDSIREKPVVRRKMVREIFHQTQNTDELLALRDELDEVIVKRKGGAS